MENLSDDFDEQDREILKELKNANEHFQYLGKQISSQEISSMLPYFDCEEPGHDGNALDQVCLDQDCRHKGLCCTRCQYQRHRGHPNSIYPLHTFVSSLVTTQMQRKLVLEEQVKKCIQYRDVVTSIIREYLNSLIDHMTDIVAQLHKYYTSFENSYENILIRSQIMVHSLIYKKHIRRDKFQRYVRDGVKSVNFDKGGEELYKPSSDFYTLSQPRPQRLEDKFKMEQGGIIINDQEKAFSMTNEYITEMQKVATKFQQLTKRLLHEMTENGQLQKFSDKIPRFEKVSDFDELKRIKDTFGVRIDNTFKTSNEMPNNDIISGGFNQITKKMVDLPSDSLIFQTPSKTLQVSQSYSRKKPDIPIDVKLNQLNNSLVQQQKGQYSRFVEQGTASISQIPSVMDYISQEQSSSILDPSRTICTLGMLFETVGNCSVLKQKVFRTQVNDISCIALLNQDVIAVGGRFNSFIDLYRLSDRKQIQRIDTKSQQGIKQMLVMARDAVASIEYSITLVVGLYFDQNSILNYQVQIFKQNGLATANVQQNVSFIKSDYDNTSAVTALKEIYQGEYFVAGFSTGTVSTYYISTSEPLHNIKNLFDSPVAGITVVDPGKIYLTHAGDKCRFHYISTLSSEKSIQNISPVKSIPQQTNVIVCTQSLVEEKSTLKLIHLICGEQKDYARVDGETREQGVRFMRMMREDVKLTIVEEGALSNFREVGVKQNSVKDILIFEPRKKMSKLWAIMIGDNNKLQLWEVRRAMSQNIKLWEKELDDFLKPMNHNLVKCKLLCESNEFTKVKFNDVGPKAQIVRVQENVHNGRFNVVVAVVNHESKNEIDFFDIELMSL